MTTWSFYKLEDGVFTGARQGGRRLVGVPPGCGAMEGAFDRLSKRVDVSTGKVVDYQPPQPDANHEWDATSKRWRKRPDVVAAEAQALRARRRIDELERAQLRPARELAIDPSNVEAKRRLAEIETEIARLRGALRIF